MILHLLKICWSRKRANALIVVEILISFVVVFALAAAGLILFQNYSDPLGYDSRNVWSIAIGRGADRDAPESAEPVAQRSWQLLDELRAIEGVVSVAAASSAPYDSSISMRGWQFDERIINAEMMWASDDLPAVLGMTLVAGTWFGREHDGQAWEPAVINAELARQLFDDRSPLNREMRDPVSAEEPELRVIGVVDDFRRGGEFAPRGEPFFFERLAPSIAQPLRLIQVKVRPGSTAELEQTMLARLQAIAPEWTFRIGALEEHRRTYLMERITMLIVGGLIAGFLLLMVVLGLTGVLWQNVSRRTREIGLRRAVGATRGEVWRQIVNEVLVTAGLALVLGTALVVQIVWLSPFDFLSGSTMLVALAVALTFMLALAAACGLYPGWTATRVPPAAALHHD